MTTTEPAKPLLLLDVDGVLNPTVSNSVARRRGMSRVRMRCAPDGWDHTFHVDPALGPPLRTMAQWFDLTWATTWQDSANDPWFRSVLHLHELPVVTFEDLAQTKSKVPGVLRYAAGQPFVWLDDDLSEAEVAWLAAEHDAPHLVIEVEEHQGLTVEHLDRARVWAESLAATQTATGTAG